MPLCCSKLIERLQTWICLLNLPSVSPICLMATVIGKKAYNCLEVALSQSLKAALSFWENHWKCPSVAKAAANKKMTDSLSQLLSATDLLPIRGEYKLWLYRNYIVSLLHFHLSVDAITKSAIGKLENLATRYLKKWLGLPRCATRALLYYPGVCCPSVSVVSREAKLSLLSCISTSGDPHSSSWGCSFIWVMLIYRLKHLIINFYLRHIYSCHLFQWLCFQRNC